MFGARGQNPLCDLGSFGQSGEPVVAQPAGPVASAAVTAGGWRVLSILEVPAVLARFELDASSFHALRHWVEAAGVRWGLDEADPQRFALPHLAANNGCSGFGACCWAMAWARGRRWLVSCHMPNSKGRRPLLGKLAAFIEALECWLPRLQQPATIIAVA